MSQVSEQPHRHLAELRRRLRQTGGRGRKLRGLLELLRPYRSRTLLMLGSLLLATAAALAPPPLAKLAIDSGITPGNLSALTWIVIAFLASAVIYWAATYAQTYLTGWVGQRVLQDLRIQLFAHLQAMSVGLRVRKTWSGRPFCAISAYSGESSSSSSCEPCASTSPSSSAGG